MNLIVIVVFFLSAIVKIRALPPPTAILALGSVLIRLEERNGLLTNTGKFVNAIVKEEPNTPAFDKAFEDGVNHVSQYPGYYLSLLTVKGSGDVIIAVHVAAQLLPALSTFFIAVHKDPFEAMKIYAKIAAEFNPCKDVSVIAGTSACVAAVIAVEEFYDKAGAILYREKITYTMEILGILKCIEEQMIPYLQTVMNQWNEVASQYEQQLAETISSIHAGTLNALPLVVAAAASVSFPFLPTALLSASTILKGNPIIVNHTPPHSGRSYLDSCHSSWNCYVIF